MDNHNLQMENRKSLTMTGVISVEGFDEETILINLEGGGLVISGKNLHIEGLDLDEGRLTAEGEIEALTYAKKKVRKPFFERFRR